MPPQGRWRRRPSMRRQKVVVGGGLAHQGQPQSDCLQGAAAPACCTMPADHAVAPCPSTSTASLLLAASPGKSTRSRQPLDRPLAAAWQQAAKNSTQTPARSPAPGSPGQRPAPSQTASRHGGGTGRAPRRAGAAGGWPGRPHAPPLLLGLLRQRQQQDRYGYRLRRPHGGHLRRRQLRAVRRRRQREHAAAARPAGDVQLGDGARGGWA